MQIGWLERLVAYYVEQHNTVMPHRAFGGQTPDEVYFDAAANLASDLAERLWHGKRGWPESDDDVHGVRST